MHMTRMRKIYIKYLHVEKYTSVPNLIHFTQSTSNMFSKLLAATALAAVAFAEKTQANLQPFLSYRDSVEVPLKYTFKYAVQDLRYNLDFSHNESRDGPATIGSYQVALPDGRTQIVTYTADQAGFISDVKYQGEGAHPKHNPKQKQSKDQLKPQTYTPFPTKKIHLGKPNLLSGTELTHVPNYQPVPGPATKPSQNKLQHLAPTHLPAIPAKVNPAPTYQPAPVSSQQSSHKSHPLTLDYLPPTPTKLTPVSTYQPVPVLTKPSLSKKPSQDYRLPFAIKQSLKNAKHLVPAFITRAAKTLSPFPNYAPSPLQTKPSLIKAQNLSHVFPATIAKKLIPVSTYQPAPVSPPKYTSVMKQFPKGTATMMINGE